ncbi:Na+/H+ antiporter NhaA, partial [Parvimonas micra]|uniref:Na+/H+ antiporter NhaA n=1 Tax=Parvimonas micra TaxID=33033 RepID=UPI002B459762
AIAVIALFYGGKLVSIYLLIILLIVLVLWYLNTRKAVFGWIHVLLGLLLWFAMFNAGIHATVAGVILAFMIPFKQLATVEIKLHVPVYFI